MLSAIKNSLSKIDLGPLILEERCRLCRELVEADVSWTFSDWQGKLDTIFGTTVKSKYKTLCLSCSSRLELAEHGFSELKISGSNKSLTVISAGRYKNDLRKLIRNLKYQDDRLIAYDLALLLVGAIEQRRARGELPLPFGRDNLILVPVPLHRKKLRKRGFNQAELIASELAKLMNLQMHRKLLIRTRDTEPQFNLSKEERQTNLVGAFKVHPQKLVNKTVVLIDDLTTTGTTIIECARTISEHQSKITRRLNPLMALTVGS